jgi:hypothetical protein
LIFTWVFLFRERLIDVINPINPKRKIRKKRSDIFLALSIVLRLSSITKMEIKDAINLKLKLRKN